MVLSLAGASCAADSVGLLSELVPWPMMVSAVPMTEVRLTPAPQEGITGLPVIPSLVFGLLALGDGPDAGVTVALSTQPTPRLWIDQDNDEDLSDETEQLPSTQITRDTYGWYVDVEVEYRAGATVVQVPHRTFLLVDKQLGSSALTFLYGGFCHRSGLLDLGGTLVPIALGTLRNDARYDDPASLLVAVDTNGDGEIDILPGSTDVYGPGGEFQVGTTLYAVKSVSPDGRRVVVDEKGTAAPRPVIAAGERAPDFEVTTVAGRTVKLSDLRGRPVVLLLAWWPESDGCVDCGSSRQEPARLPLLREVGGSYGDRVAVVVVATNASPLATGLLPLEPGSILAAQDSSVGELYRRVEGLFVLDRDGFIAAMDVPWSTVSCDVPVGSLDVLSDAEVEDCLYKLLSE
ncbi:MAG: redoxin domain-containing protein [Candidatus Bipolaricaulota bacterium]